MPFAVVDLQGFYVRGVFIPKELALIGNQSPVYHYTFKSSLPFFTLSECEKQQVRYLVRNHHGISYHVGQNLDYEIKDLLENFIKAYKIDEIYVKGHNKKDFLDKLLSINIINLEHSDEKCPKLEKTLNICSKNIHKIKPAMCAFYNTKMLYKFLVKYF